MPQIWPPGNLNNDGAVWPPPTDQTGGTGSGDIWRNVRVRLLDLVSDGSSFSAYGLTVPSAPTAGVAASGATWITSRVYGRLDTAAGANSTLTKNIGAIDYWLGNAASYGGFRYECTWGVDTTQTTLRAFVGLIAGAGSVSLATDPSNLTNCVFMGCDAADTNMQIMQNDAAGTCTKTDLGASFPKTSGVGYRVVFTCVANAGTISYTVDRLDSSATQATGTLSTNLPSNTTFLGLQVSIGNGGTAASAKMAFLKLMTEQSQPA